MPPKRSSMPAIAEPIAEVRDLLQSVCGPLGVERAFTDAGKALPTAMAEARDKRLAREAEKAEAAKSA